MLRAFVLTLSMQPYDIQIIASPSTLGLQSTGVEWLAESLLSCGLAEKLECSHEIIHVPTLNHIHDNNRDSKTHCLNPRSLRSFSLKLGKVILNTINQDRFAFVLGGDCSLLLGIMPALKKKGNYGLIFIDAHADFYEPEKSATGEAADMDLALITGRGPELLTDINRLRPYVTDENVVHIGQRDWEETRQYDSQDIKKTSIKCYDLDMIRQKGIDTVIKAVSNHIVTLMTDGFWIHFDTDVLDDAINPAVDYRLKGGLSFNETEKLIGTLLSTGKIAGISVTIFNPLLDNDGRIAQNITNCLAKSFTFGSTGPEGHK